MSKVQTKKRVISDVLDDELSAISDDLTVATLTLELCETLYGGPQSGRQGARELSHLVERAQIRLLQAVERFEAVMGYVATKD